MIASGTSSKENPVYLNKSHKYRNFTFQNLFYAHKFPQFFFVVAPHRPQSLKLNLMN